MAKGFCYNGEWFMPYRNMTKAEQERPIEAIRERLNRYSNEEFEKYWDLDDFYRKSGTDVNLFWWKGKLVMPSWDTFYIINGWF